LLGTRKAFRHVAGLLLTGTHSVLACPERSYSGQTASACLTDQFNPRSWVCYATQLRSADSERKNGSAFSAKIAPRTGGNTSKKWQFPGRTWHGIRLIKRLFKGESNPII
jgi:hypothetical protein